MKHFHPLICNSTMWWLGFGPQGRNSPNAPSILYEVKLTEQAGLKVIVQCNGHPRQTVLDNPCLLKFEVKPNAQVQQVNMRQGILFSGLHLAVSREACEQTKRRNCDCFLDYSKAFICVLKTNWNIMREMRFPAHLIHPVKHKMSNK